MVVSNRYNLSLDQRISIRGFGSRSNFGVRGLKILLDGVPQTLPDGQSQLKVSEIGPFAQIVWPLGADSEWLVNAGTRFDWVRFDVLTTTSGTAPTTAVLIRYRP